jgi:hypothetical protein
MVDGRNTKEAKHVINQSLLVLEHAMDLAVQKEDLDAMIGISDRLMMLYQYMADKGPKKFKAGFTLNQKDEEQDDESD